MSQTDPQFKLRLPEDLLESIKSAAAANGRSINAEIIFALRAHSFGEVASDATVVSRLDRIIELMEARHVER